VGFTPPCAAGPLLCPHFLFSFILALNLPTSLRERGGVIVTWLAGDVVCVVVAGGHMWLDDIVCG
jgi:hypothetical protein